MVVAVDNVFEYQFQYDIHGKDATSGNVEWVSEVTDVSYLHFEKKGLHTISTIAGTRMILTISNPNAHSLHRCDFEFDSNITDENVSALEVCR
jgi:hypothetical protein